MPPLSVKRTSETSGQSRTIGRCRITGVCDLVLRVPGCSCTGYRYILRPGSSSRCCSLLLLPTHGISPLLEFSFKYYWVHSQTPVKVHLCSGHKWLTSYLQDNSLDFRNVEMS